MCGRFYIDDDTAKQIQHIIANLDNKLRTTTMKKGEIYPANTIAILGAANGRLKPYLSKWGFPGFTNKGVIINARSETALEKKMFRESLLSRRCVIPASGFYEWNKNKEKIYFTSNTQKIMYMAGLYNTFKEELRFVILTTNANSSIEDVHNRMPLLLTNETLTHWILDNSATQTILNSTPCPVNRSSEYTQQKLYLT